jgi:hypothetical protein
MATAVQVELFGTGAEIPVNSSVTDAPERLRLGGQHRRFLDLLPRDGATVRLTNVDLSAIANRFTARIHELRGAGWIDYRMIAKNGGLTTYEMRRTRLEAE